jgi:hypothetical protein
MREPMAWRLLYAVLRHIQSERSPIYRAAWRPSRFQLPISWLYLLLLLSIPLLRLIEVSSGVPLFIYRDQALVAISVLGAAAVSLAPYGLLAALSALGIARLRSAQAWDMFLLTPSEPYEVITATAAASVRPQWRAILGSGLLGILLGLMAAVAAALGLMAREAWLWAIVLLGCGALLPYMRLQEAALSLLIGVQLSHGAPRSAFILGMMSGIALRLAMSALALLLGGEAHGLAVLSAEIVRLADILPSNAALIGSGLAVVMALLLGEIALIVFAPNALSALTVLLIFFVRSVLVRQLALRQESA